MPTPGPGTTGSGTPASPAPNSTPSSSWTSRACPTCSGRSSATTSSRAARRARPRGGDATRPIELTLAEAAFGVTREVAVDVIAGCERCGATGAEPGTQPRAVPGVRRLGPRPARRPDRVRPVRAGVGLRGVRRPRRPHRLALPRLPRARAGCRPARASRCRCRAGIASGQRLRLAGRGHDGEGGAGRPLRAGDRRVRPAVRA